MAGALSFAHLLGLPSAAAAKAEDDEEKDRESKAEDDDDKQREGESDEDYAKRMEEKDDDERAEDDEKDEPEQGGKRADDEDDGSSARRAERSRCAAIIAFGIKNGCVRQAGVFAFDTDLSDKQAIAALTASGIDNKRGSSLASRMADMRVPNVGADGGGSGNGSTDAASAAKATADLIIRAGKKRRNEET
ncbi:MAG: hypothetical protein J7605_02570 [Variovorax sp.]|nr:hypothetical protein [Variovorax sp.]